MNNFKIMKPLVKGCKEVLYVKQNWKKERKRVKNRISTLPPFKSGNYHTWKKSGLISSTLSKSGKADFERPMASNTVALLKYVRKLSGSPSETNRATKINNKLVISIIITCDH